MLKFKLRSVEGVAFCPAHVTGFFKADLDPQKIPEQLGSMGAGFSIKIGVTTRVNVSKKNENDSNFKITTSGYGSTKTDVSEFVLNEFLKKGSFEELFFDINHEIKIPVGYGLGSSGAVALSLAFALNKVLGTNLDKVTVGQIAHKAEVNCKTGLGDVLASYHGGFEIRTEPGAPGIGRLKNIDAKNVSVVMICFSPISTNDFLRERISQINGLGGKMVTKLLESKNLNHFQEMSLEFSRYVDVITPKMENVIEKLKSNGIGCGVALFGETIFSVIPKQEEPKVVKLLEEFSEGIILRSELDELGARILSN